MKKYLILTVLSMLSLLLVGCGTQSAGAPTEIPSAPAITAGTAAPAPDTDGKSAKQAVYIKITAEEAKARIDSGDQLVILDVRTQAEFDAGHIEGAILIPNETIAETQPSLLPDLDAEILIYCRSGNRSRQAAEKLLAMGYTNVYDFGGVIDWPYGTVTK